MPEQIAGVSFLVWLACVYALGLVAVGWGFDILAKRTSQRMVAARTFGFTYHEESDAWLCPKDQWLWATAFDSDNRVMRYRAKPSVCNTCPMKDSCTVSANGRELTREVDEWPYSESGRFHRGLAVAVSLLGVVVMIGAAIVWHSPLELLVEAAAVVVVLSLTYPLAIKLMRSPANFEGDPKHIHASTADESVNVKMDRFAAKWGGVSNERKRRTEQTRKLRATHLEHPPHGDVQANSHCRRHDRAEDKDVDPGTRCESVEDLAAGLRACLGEEDEQAEFRNHLAGGEG